MSQKRVLITGASGLLGSNMALYFLRNGWNVHGSYCLRHVCLQGGTVYKVDLTDPAAATSLVEQSRPDLVLHCAAGTDINALQRNSQAAHDINVRATAHLIRALEGCSAHLIYISTDAVYGGADGPHVEESATVPANVYGQTKLEGEGIALSRTGSLVLRTNFFGFSPSGRRSLAEWFLKALRAGEAVLGFENALFSPLYVGLLAALIADCAALSLDGVYNCAARDSLSKLDFGRKLARAFGYPPELLIPTRMDALQGGVPRLEDLRLDSSRLARRLGREMPSVSEGLAAMHEESLKGLAAQMETMAAKREQCIG